LKNGKKYEKGYYIDCIGKIKTKQIQNKTKQNKNKTKTKQNKTKQNKTKQIQKLCCCECDNCECDNCEYYYSIQCKLKNCTQCKVDTNTDTYISVDCYKCDSLTLFNDMLLYDVHYSVKDYVLD